MKKIVFAIVLVLALSASAREAVSPTRIVWSTNATDVALLVSPRLGQVPEGRFLEGSGAKLTVGTNGISAVLLDFGREWHGAVRIGNGVAGRGARVRVRLGESVTEAMAELGEKDAQNDHALRDFTETLPWLGTREFGNSGFRFVRIDAVEGTADLQFVQVLPVLRDMSQIGSFRCSDERLNQVFDTAVRTVHLCCQDYLWDGIKRDRLVWMGDTHPETLVILPVFGAASVLPASLDYMAATTSPSEWMNGMPTYTLWWIRNLAEWYRYTGDLKYLQKHAAYLEKTFDHVLTRMGPDGWLGEGAMGSFLDWPTHGNPEAERAGTQGLALLTARETEMMAKALGLEALAKNAQEMAESITVGKVKSLPKSAAAMLALSGLAEPKEMFEKSLGREGHAGVSTFYGYYMIEAISAAGEQQRALDTVRDYWGGMLDVGATSFWEDFDLAWTNNCFRIDELPVPSKTDIHGDYGKYCYKGFRHSLCHGWAAGPAAWCFRRVLGIEILEPGCKRLRINPALGDLDWAEGAMALPTGEAIKVRVHRSQSGAPTVEVEKPDWVVVAPL